MKTPVPGLKVELDRICHRLVERFGPLPSLYDKELDDGPALYPPARPQQIEQAERDLGFALPPLLVAVYTRIGNGGAALGLMGLPGGQSGWDVFEDHDIVSAYQIVMDWATQNDLDCPRGRVPIYDGHGCGMVSFLNCASSEGEVWLRDSGIWDRTHATLLDYLVPD
jgi:hypothetical protein